VGCAIAPGREGFASANASFVVAMEQVTSLNVISSSIPIGGQISTKYWKSE
jgi:hypothetical protein